VRNVKIGALGGIALAMCGGSALAQQLYQPFIAAQGAVSSPKAADTQTINFFASETYNSNVAQSDAALAAERGLTQSDEITTVGFNATVIQTLGVQRFFLKGDFGYDWYARNHVLDTARADFVGGDTVRLGDCQATVQGDYYRGRNDTPILSTEAVENVRSTGSIGGNATCGHQYGLVPNVSVTERWNSDTAEIYKGANSRVFTAAGGLDFRTPTLGSLGLYGEYDNIAYNQTFVGPEGARQTDQFDVWTGGLKYSKQLTPTLGAQAFLTYTNVDSNTPNSADFDGLTYSFSLTYSVAPRLSATAYFSREVLPSDVPYETYTVVETYHALINYAAAYKLHLQLEGGLNDYDYRGSTGFGLLTSQFDFAHQTTYRVQGEASYDLNDHFRAGLLVAEVRRDADFQGLSYWATIVAIRLTANFGH